MQILIRGEDKEEQRGQKTQQESDPQPKENVAPLAHQSGGRRSLGEQFVLFVRHYSVMLTPCRMWRQAMLAREEVDERKRRQGPCEHRDSDPVPNSLASPAQLLHVSHEVIREINFGFRRRIEVNNVVCHKAAS